MVSTYEEYATDYAHMAHLLLEGDRVVCEEHFSLRSGWVGGVAEGHGPLAQIISPTPGHDQIRFAAPQGDSVSYRVAGADVARFPLIDLGS